MVKPLAILIVGNVESDLKSILRLLKKAGFKPASEQVRTPTQLRRALIKQAWQVVISAINLPKLDGGAALRIVQETRPDTSFIVVADKIDEQAALDMVKDGAVGWVLMEDLPHLVPMLERELKLASERQERKGVEAALRESEEKWRSLVNATPDFVALHDVNGKYLYMNHYAKGFTEKEVIGTSAYQYMTPDSVEVFRSHMENAVKTSKTQHFEFTGLGDNGAKKIYEEYLVPLRDKNQQVEILAVARDITERRRVQEALRESEDKFKYVFDHSVTGKSITLPGGELNVNQAFCKMLGYTQKELKNKRWQEITHPHDVELTQQAIDKLVSGEKESVHFIKRFIHKNGSTVWAELGSAVRRDEQGKPLYFITSLVDITERKLAEETLRDLSQRQEAILDATPDILMEVNQDKLYTWANPAGLEFFGRDVIGKTADYYFEGDQSTYRDVSPLFQGNKEVIYVESWQRRKDGKKRLLAWWCRSIRDKDGKVRGALSSAHDVTEERKAEQVLQESEQRLTSIYDTVGNVIFYLAVEGDGQYRFTSVNPAFERVTGIPLGQVIGRRVDEVIPRPSLSMVLGKYRQAIDEKTVVRWEETTVYPTGRLVGEVSVSPVLDVNGTCTHLVGSVHDITERTMMEDALRDSEERFHSLFKNMLNGFAYCHMLFDHGDPVDFTYLEVNEAFETLTGLKDVVGKKVSEVIPGVRRDPIRSYSRCTEGWR